jgi:hypothetical protein
LENWSLYNLFPSSALLALDLVLRERNISALLSLMLRYMEILASPGGGGRGVGLHRLGGHRQERPPRFLAKLETIQPTPSNRDH